MDASRKNKVIGIVTLAIGLLCLTMFAIEVKDGVLQGSRVYGLTRESDPITFYISTGFEFLIGIGLTVFGVYSIRRKV